MQPQPPSAWPTQPLDRIYRLEDRLGEGGMGTVFRATNLLDGRLVAVKLVAFPKTSNNSTQVGHNHLFRLALAREFQTLASFHHPNVVRVYSYGFDPDLGPYVAMELLENSQHFLVAARRFSDKEKPLLLVQLLRALVYVHQRGVIHRDIKPGNVLVTFGPEGPIVKLVDFGIATGDAQTVRLAGTVEYMAPELLLGNPPTPATDLWAVGVLLYQLLMGRLPFADRTPTEVLGEILGESRDQTLPPTSAAFLKQYRNGQRSSPRPIQWTAATTEPVPKDRDTTSFALRFAPTVPSFLLNYQGPFEVVLRKLLAHKPEDRYQDAADVLTELGQALEMPLHIETKSTRESFLQATNLIGREAELNILGDALQSACSGQGSAWLLGGESGVGKSRLLFELRTLALVHGAWVVEGQAVTEGGVFFQGFPPLLRALCLRVDISDAEAAILKDLVPEVPRLLGRPIPEAVKIKPEESLQRLVETLLGLLARLSSPLLLVFEDLHWARSESLELLAKLLPSLAQLPVLIVGSFRSDESPELPARLTAARYLPLTRLGRPDIERLSTSILGRGQIRPELINYLERQTEGNVFFLIEVLRSLAESAGELRSIGTSELPEQLLTSGIERIIDKRLERLQGDNYLALELSAVFGRQLDPGLLTHIYPALRLQDFLIQAANAAVLELIGTEWRFAHDKLREGVLRRLSNAQKRTWHGRIAEALESIYSEVQRQRHSAILAFHFREAGLQERAVSYYLRAGSEAWRLYLLENAQAQYAQVEALLSVLPPTATTRGQRIDLLVQQIQVSFLTEYVELQLTREQAARALLSQLHDSEGRLSQEDRKREARLNLAIGRVHYYSGQPAIALRLFREVLAVAHEFNDQELQLFPACVTSQLLTAHGQMYAAKALLDPVVEPLRQLGYVVDSARILAYQAIQTTALGNCQQGLNLILDGIKQAKLLNQPSVLGLLKVMRTVITRFSADWQALRECALDALDYVRNSSDKVYLFPILCFAGWSDAYLGRHQSAAEYFTEAFALARATGNRVLLVDWMEAANAERCLLAGDAATALTLASGMVERYQDAKLVLSEGIAERVWGCALGRLGAPQSEVEAHFQKSVQIHREFGNILDSAQTEQWWGRICKELGDEPAAQAHFAQALAIFESAGCQAAQDAIRLEARGV